MRRYGSNKRTTSSRLEKINRVYTYLVKLVESGEDLPNLTELHKSFNDTHISNLMEVLKDLDKRDKIVYRKGKILAVVMPNKQEEKEETKETKEEVKNTMSDLQLELKNNYDKAVKDLIAEYIKNANISTKDEMVDYINAIMGITDKLKERLF